MAGSRKALLPVLLLSWLSFGCAAPSADEVDRFADVIEWVEQHESSGFVWLERGRPLIDVTFDVDEPRWRRMASENEGRVVEDVASVQKSVVAVLIGMAESRGLVAIDAPVSSYLGAGWSGATAEQEERIHVRHLLSMSSGLDDQLRFEARAGSRWRYNTPAYSRLIAVLESVTGQSIEEVSSAWLTRPLGMIDSAWRARPGAGPNSPNRHGFVTHARDLARFGVFLMDGARIDGQPTMRKSYRGSMWQTSQTSQPNYGWLWWLNQAGAGSNRGIPGAPVDAVAARGALVRLLYVVPSRGWVIARVGAQPGDGFEEGLWRRLLAAR